MNGSQEKPPYFQYARRMIFLGIVLVPLVPYLGVLIISFLFFINSSIDNSRATMRQTVEHQAQAIERFLEERVNDLAFVFQTYSPEQLADSRILGMVFEQLHEATGALVDLGLIDASGKHVAYHGPHALLDKHYSDTEWFKATRAQGEYVSDVFLGHRGIPHFVVTKSSGGEHPTILRVTIDSDAFSKIVESVRIGRTGEAFLLNLQGLYQTRHPGKWELLDKAHDFPVLGKMAAGSRTLAFESGDGRNLLAAGIPLNKGRWLLVAQQEVQDALSDSIAAGKYVLIVSAFGGLIALSLASVASNHMGKALADAEEEKAVLRERLARSVRLTELGEMAAGFAHEINNPLQIVRAELTLMRMLFGGQGGQSPLLAANDAAEIRDSLEQSLVQIDRCADITASVLRFGRNEPAEAATIVPERLLQSIGSLVEKRAFAHGIVFRREVKSATPAILCDIGKAQQVFLNLLNNALYAIVERWGKEGGRLEFTAEPAGSAQVVVKVSDNGGGMPKAVLGKIYTPFFTTKPPEKGAGLGLAVCYGLVESMGGTIEVVSREGEGTVFSVRLPAAAPEEERTSDWSER